MIISPFGSAVSKSHLKRVIFAPQIFQFPISVGILGGQLKITKVRVPYIKFAAPNSATNFNCDLNSRIKSSGYSFFHKKNHCNLPRTVCLIK